MMRSICYALLILAYVGLIEGKADGIDFVTDVEPILATHCLDCHGPQRQQSGIRLDQRNSLLKGGDFERPAIVPGKPEESLLIELVRGDDADLRMPPEGDPLSEPQIRILEQWISEGADWPGQMESPIDQDPEPNLDQRNPDHWAFKPLSLDPSGFAHHSIDAFIEAQLAERGLSRSPPADPATLLRRVSLVLTGLPPTLEEVSTVEEIQDVETASDGFDAAYRRAVDRLLDSPRYGERWAQHWLDVIRWAETVGFETNAERPNTWHYRDWLIAALNEDKPYNEFLFDQIAGDVSGHDAAIGFLVSGPANLPGQIGRDEEAMRQARQDELDEIIGTVSQSVLGLTVRCARCHHHKFDPVSQQDYYAMQAIFAGTFYGERRLRGEEDDQWTEQVPAAREKLQRLEDELSSMRGALGLKEPLNDLHTDTFDAKTISAIRMKIQATADGSPASLYELEVWSAAGDDSAPRNVALASNGAVPSASSFALANQTRHFDNLVDGTRDRRQAFPWVADSAGPAWVQIDLASPEKVDRVTWDRGSSVPADYTIEARDAKTNQWVTVADSADRLPRLDDTRAPKDVRLKDLAPDQVESLIKKIAEVRAARRQLDRLSAGPQAYAARFIDAPEPTWLLHRGDPMQRRERVSPSIPAFLGNLDWQEDQPESARRVALARHLTRPDHPLTARVIVNRIWQHHFGEGLVDTPSDFGRMGSKPMNGELLDWLAATFIADRWSLKQLHRRIVLSETFRQASFPNDTALPIDSESRLLWRFPPRRLEAEAIRDSILAISGKLNPKQGGRGFDFFQQRGGLSGFTPIEAFDESGWRRMIYAHKIRMQEVDVFGAFDCPDAGQMKPKRTRSITPTQSLGLLNSPFVLRQAAFFAQRVEHEAGDDTDSQVERAFLLALSRRPTTSEQTAMTELVKEHGLVQLCRVLLNTSEFLSIQ